MTVVRIVTYFSCKSAIKLCAGNDINKYFRPQSNYYTQITVPAMKENPINYNVRMEIQ